MRAAGALAPWLGLVAVVLFAAATALVGYAAASGETVLSRLYARYVAHLDRSLRLLFRPEVGRQIVLAQGIALGVLVAAQLFVRVPFFPAWIVLALGGPSVALARARAQRLAKLEAQVDGFVLALANALKTVPSPAAALQSTTLILPQPTRQEVEHVLKEVRMGSTIEEALLAMSARVRSRWVDVAFSAVLIGLRVGGNLPAVLERTAAMLREMNRLLGVVRTRTSQGRAQLWVLAGFPVFVVAVFDAVRPGYFDPLQTSFIGQLCVGAAAVLWILSLLVARSILKVDV